MLNRIQRQVARIGLSSTARQVSAAGLTYLIPEKMFRLESGAKEILAKGVTGDVIEFGVALGGSAIVLASLALKYDRRFFGLDVFGMIPPPTSVHDDDKSRDRYEVIKSGRSTGIGGANYYGYEEDLHGKVVKSFEKHGLSVDGRRTSLVKGLFEETWPTIAGNAIAFVHIDCDWYDPVRYCLNAVHPYLSPGGAMLLDDYYDYGGCKTATDEFLREHPDYVVEDGPNLRLRRSR